MAMKKLLFAVIALSLFACSSEKKETDRPPEAAQISKGEQEQQESEAPVIYTAKGEVEGYFEEIYILPEDNSAKSLDELPEFNLLHVIPAYTDADGIGRFMNTVAENDFGLYGALSEYSGPVVLFYDKEKKHKAATFESLSGKPDGIATVFTPKGRILIKREYDHGKWTKSFDAPACADWHYNQSKSNLSINDLKNGKITENGTTIISLVPSMQASANYEEILDKSSYERPFTVNNKKYTGKLIAYNWTASKEDYPAFELNFENGSLDGDVKIYSDIFGLTLHEVFENGDLTETVYALNPGEMDGMAKPIIYFYPEDTTELVVKLNLDGELTHSYPKYHEQWKVTAHPDGTLIDENGQEYYALYWEGENKHPFTLNEGSVVSGENTVAFLEASLKTLGLNRREANEFIMYWLPRMENNAFNLIHFSTDEYEAIAQLDIEPKPETIIRVMMVFEPLNSSISIPEQDLNALGKSRNGFTVVEWGGKELHRMKVF
ncbi:MAG: hypothetical protein Crog4KO_22460 [Crocinitomicaceae bacterium]